MTNSTHHLLKPLTSLHFIAMVMYFAPVAGCSDRSIKKNKPVSLAPLSSMTLSNGVQLVHQGIGVQPASSWLIAQLPDGRRQSIEGGCRYHLAAITEIGDELHVASTSWPLLAGHTSVYQIDSRGLYERIRIQDRFRREIDLSHVDFASIDVIEQGSPESRSRPGDP